MYLDFSVLIAFGIILSALLSFWLSNLIPVSLFFVGAMVSIIHLVFMLSFQDVIYNINYRQRNNENKEASDEIRRLNKSIRALSIIPNAINTLKTRYTVTPPISYYFSTFIATLVTLHLPVSVMNFALVALGVLMSIELIAQMVNIIRRKEVVRPC